MCCLCQCDALMFCCCVSVVQVGQSIVCVCATACLCVWGHVHCQFFSSDREKNKKMLCQFDVHDD